MKKYLVSWTEPGGKKEALSTPFLEGKGQAFFWLFQRKPYVIQTCLGTVTVKEWQRGDPR